MPCFLKSLLAAALMYAAVFFLDKYLSSALSGDAVSLRLVRLFVPAVAGAVVYAVFGYILRIDYIVNIVNKILRRGEA